MTHLYNNFGVPLNRSDLMRRKTWEVCHSMAETPRKHYLLASDFDQTLSFKDSGLVLSELLGISAFEDRVAGLAGSNLVQQGGELAYLIRHDPEFRGVRPEHLIEAGRRVRLKSAIPALVDFLNRGTEGYRFSFFVISAAPREIVASALAPDRMIDVGDGSSDVHVMLHVNNRDGFTIAVSENQQLARIANSTVLSDYAFSVLVAILGQLLGW